MGREGSVRVCMCACAVHDILSSGMVSHSGCPTGVGISGSETRFLNRLSLDLVAIMVVRMAP